MPKTYLTTKPLTASAETAAKLSFAAAALVLVLLAALHFLKPEFDPSWRFVSEYEIGRHGWVMQAAFISLALSCVASFVAVRSQVQTLGGRIGLALLLLSAAGQIIAAFGVADPVTATNDQLTTHGFVHGLGATIGIPGLPIAAVLISLSLRRNQDWSSGRGSFLWVAHLIWISTLVMFVTLFVLLSQNGGKFGPNVIIGWPNRFVVVSYCAWLMLVAWRAVKLRGQRACREHAVTYASSGSSECLRWRRASY